MAEKINIEDLMVESYSDKTLKSYSGMIADPKSVFGLGSAAATSSMFPIRHPGRRLALRSSARTPLTRLSCISSCWI